MSRASRVAVACAFGVVAVGCSGSASSGSGDTTVTGAATQGTATPTQPRATGPTYPLTGLPVEDQAAAARPALVVKIDNDPAASPQSGLNAADIVFETIIEGQTRFAAVFHSQGSDPVGPIRSGRSQDIDLLGGFDRPLYAWSGGNPAVTAAIEASDLYQLSALNTAVWDSGGFFRDPNRANPHDQFANTSSLWTLAPSDANPPPQQFQYRADTDEAQGQPVAGVDLYLEGALVSWRFDPATNAFLRSNNGEPHNDAGGARINTTNVVILVTSYHPYVADERSPEADTVGFGEAWVLSGGNLVQGIWTRADRLSPFVLTGPDGVITLVPGRTWVEMAMFGTFNVVL